MESLILLATISWVGIVKLLVIFVLLGAVLYFGKKYLDAEAYATIKAKIVALEIKAESEYTGKGQGNEKLQYTCDLAEKVLTDKELKIAGGKKGVRKIAQVVFSAVASSIIKSKLK